MADKIKWQPTFAEIIAIDKSFINDAQYKRHDRFEICANCGYPYGMHLSPWGIMVGCPSSVSHEWYAWGRRCTSQYRWSGPRVNHYRTKKFERDTNGKTEAFMAYLRLKGAVFSKIKESCLSV